MDDNKTINLDDLLAGTSLDDVSAESSGYDELKSGYYLSEVTEAKLGNSKSSGLPMVSFRFKVIQDGIIEMTDEENNTYFTRAKHTENRNIFKNYVLKDQKSIKTLVSDLLKYEGDVQGTPILDEILTVEDENGKKKTSLPSTEVLMGCLEVLTGLTIFVKVDVREDKEDKTKTNTWTSLVSWSRATELGLLSDELIVEEE